MSKFIEINDERYPASLRKIFNPPKRIFYKGNIDLLQEISFAVIGTRHVTDYGKKMTRKFTKEIALRDICVVSGMALGVDTIAHTETLRVGGKTVAVLGAGLNNIYPKENEELFKNIITGNGLIISEYEDDIKPESFNFPKRNRIVAGITEATLVIEAGYRSGTSITADFAWKFGKKVYAIPGRLDNKYGVGVNRLIRKGAILVTNVNDILIDFPELQNRNKRIVSYNLNIKKEYRKIYNVIGNEIMSIDEIALKTQNDVVCVSKLLVLMEMEDLIEEKMGGYIRKKVEEV